jgi:hypothetical protein
MRTPNPTSSRDRSSGWKGAFVARLVRLCPDVGTEAAAEVSEAAHVTNQGMPPAIAAEEWAALWVRRVRPRANITAPASQNPRLPAEIDPQPSGVKEPSPPPITGPGPSDAAEPIRTTRGRRRAAAREKSPAM